jgi:putative transposase
VRLKHRIDEVYTQGPFYGARKIAAQLQREGMGINRKTAGRYMREMGIAAIYPGPNLSKRNQGEGVYPYVVRHITSAYPNHIWGIDITYMRPAWRLDVPGGDPGLVLSLGGQLGTRSDAGVALCA